MTILDALVALAALLAATVGVGIVLRVRDGRVRRARTAATGDVVDPAALGADGLGPRATLLQFSTELCARCPGAHRMLSAVAADHDGVRHLDVDLTHRPDLAKRFSVLQTPTTLILDARGAVRSRIGGVPGREVVELELARLTQETADV